MKINVTVDLSDFYSEGDEQSFSEQIKQSIAYDVRTKILNDWREKINVDFSNEIKAEIEAQKGILISETVKMCFDAKQVKERYGSAMVSIEEYVNGVLDNDLKVSESFQSKLRGWSEKATNEITKELKDRYDLLFASNLVSKMNELGMLKPDVAQLILNK
jgi:hypothetical protein